MLTARHKSLCFRYYNIRSSWTPRPSDSSKQRFWYYFQYPTMRRGNSQEHKGKCMDLGGTAMFSGIEPSHLLCTWVYLRELQLDQIPREGRGTGQWGLTISSDSLSKCNLTLSWQKSTRNGHERGEPEIQDFCKVTVHMQGATRICMKEQGEGFVERTCIWDMSIRNLWQQPPQMVQRTSAVLPREGALGVTGGW